MSRRLQFQILDKTKKRKIIEKLEKFEIKKIPYLLLQTGKEKIRAYSGSLSTEELYSLSRLLKIESIGLYFAKQHTDNTVRLTPDALHLNEIKKQITKSNQNTINLNKEQEIDWFHGKDVELTKEQIKEHQSQQGFILIQSKNTQYFLGTGKLSHNNTALSNFMPKQRRIKQKS